MLLDKSVQMCVLTKGFQRGGGGGGGGILPSVQTDPQTISGTVKVILLKLFYYQTFLKLGVINIHDMNIKKMQ